MFGILIGTALWISVCVCVCVGVNTSKYIYESYIPSFTFWCISLRLQVSGNEEISYNFGDIKTLVNIPILEETYTERVRTTTGVEA